MKLNTYDKFYNCGPSAELSKYNFIKTFIKKNLNSNKIWNGKDVIKITD